MSIITQRRIKVCLEKVVNDTENEKYNAFFYHFTEVLEFTYLGKYFTMVNAARDNTKLRLPDTFKSRFFCKNILRPN